MSQKISRKTKMQADINKNISRNDQVWAYQVSDLHKRLKKYMEENKGENHDANA